MKVRHRVLLYVEKECDDKAMTATQLKRWIDEQFSGCDYGSVTVKEVTTNQNGKEIDHKDFK